MMEEGALTSLMLGLNSPYRTDGSRTIIGVRNNVTHRIFNNTKW